MMRYLEALLLQQRGDNRPLVAEIKEKLSPAAQERLYRVLQDMQQEASSERRKRRQGQFWG
jgi:hypothetical protein